MEFAGDFVVNEALYDWAKAVVDTTPERYPRGIITMGVEAWELGECQLGSPTRTDEGYDMTIGHTERFHGYYFNCPRCGAEVRPSMAKCHGAKVADAIQCPVCGIPATLSILEGRRDAMAMTWSCAYCFTSKTFKDEDLDDINAAQCPHCGLVNLFEEESK